MKAREILVEGRIGIQELKLDAAVSFAVKHCADYLKAFDEPPVFRGAELEDSYYVVNPLARTRPSANTTNEYNLILSNDKSWAAYPKRERSIICTFNIMTSQGFGDPYAVILPNQFRLGVCSAADLWFSFGFLTKKTGIDDLSFFNHNIRNLISNAGINGKDYRDIKDLYADLLLAEKRLKDYRAHKKDKGQPESKHFYDAPLTDYLIKTIKQDSPAGSMYNAIVHLLTPVNNKFQLVESIAELNGMTTDDEEVWTDATCLLVPVELYQTFRNAAFKKPRR